jgi:flagellar protein FliS
MADKMRQSGTTTYQQITTMSLDQIDLILMVYRGAITELRKAGVAFEEDRFVDGRDACDKARKCIIHLYTTLDMDKGGEIASRLAQLYIYMVERLDIAVSTKGKKNIDEIISLLEVIKEGWEGVDRGVAVGPGVSLNNSAKAEREEDSDRKTQPHRQTKKQDNLSLTA